MGIQLNLGDHRSRNPDFISIPRENVADAKWARIQAIAIANSRPSANVYFRSLPGHRSLSSLLADRSIWVNYWVGFTVEGGAFTLDGISDIGLSYWAFRHGRRYVLSTLIHELAHVDGAPDNTTQAEDALVHCGLGTLAEMRTGIDDPSTPYIPGHHG